MSWVKSLGSVLAAPVTGGASLLGLAGGDSKTTAAAGASMFAPTMLLGSASALGESIYNNYASRKATKAQNEWNLAQWERENAYNHPAEIMKRYQEAGLNPNLIYGNSYESPAHLESAKQQHVPLNLNMAHNLLAMYNLEAQNMLLDAQIKETNSRISNTDSNTDLKDLQYADLLRRLTFEEETGLDYNSTAGKIARFISSNYSPKRSGESMSDRVIRNRNELFNQDEEFYHFFKSGFPLTSDEFDRVHRYQAEYYRRYGRFPK